MFELLIPLALIGTFGAILIGGMAVEAFLTDRRRAVAKSPLVVGDLAGGAPRPEMMSPSDAATTSSKPSAPPMSFPAW